MADKDFLLADADFIDKHDPHQIDDFKKATVK